MRKAANGLLLVLMIITFFGMRETVYAADEEIIGSYNVIGTEDMDYNLDLKVITRSTEFNMDDEKLSFYMLGGDLVEQGDDYYRFIVRNNEYGIKFVFISPEAGRVSGKFSTADFYPDRNSIIRIKDVDYVTYRNVDGTWEVQIGDEVLDPTIMYVETGVDGDILETQDNVGDPGNYYLNLDNYTLRKDNADFVFYYGFSKNSNMSKVFENPGITFIAEEIMLRTFESRMQETNTSNEIVSYRTPSSAMIGQTIRMTGNSDDGDNLATITSVDSDTNTIYVQYVNSSSYNYNGEGTWIRCHYSSTNEIVTTNEYPRIYLSPTFWTIEQSAFQSLFDFVSDEDPTGLLDTISISVDDQNNFGYSLRNVTYTSDGLNFRGGINGGFDIAVEFDFFDRSIEFEKHIDYGTSASSLSDQILRIDTYKKEAVRFNFDPDMFSSYTAFEDMGSLNPPSTFPLRFRLYFDKDLDIIGGNVRVNIPGKGIPLPGGLIYVDNIGGGYCSPGRFEIEAKFTSFDLNAGFPLWQADAEMILDLDENYVELNGSSWIFGKTIQIGDFDATVAWSYTTGKYYRGVDVHGEVGVAKSSVELIAEITFKVKRYKSSGETKTYIGGYGEARIEAFGMTFSNVSVKASLSRMKASVYVRFLGRKSVTVKYADVVKNITGLSDIYDPNLIDNIDYDTGDYGVATMFDDFGNQITLIPEAKRLERYDDELMDVNTVNLSNAIVEGAIVVNYTGDLDNVTVTLPNASTKTVEIVQEDSVYDSNVLYAMDYEISDTQRQLYIQLDDPQIGDYTVDSGATAVDEISFYEITPVPQLEQLNVSTMEDVAYINWELNQEVVDAEYHLSLIQLNDNGEIIAEHSLFEDYEDDANVTHETYIPIEAISGVGVAKNMSVELPDYLPDGTYQFVIEPVLVNESGDNFYGGIRYSNSFTIDNPESVPAVTSIASDYIGDGITEISFSSVGIATGYEIVIEDDTNAIIETIGLSADELLANGNIEGGMVTITTTLEQDVETDVFLANVLYETPYTYTIYSLLEVYKSFGDVYDLTSGNIVMENISESQDETYTYMTPSVESAIQFTEYNKISVSTSLTGNGYTKETGIVNEEPDLETEYVYDMEDESVDVEILTVNIPDEIYNMPGLENLGVLPNQEVSEFGFSIYNHLGEVIFEMPVVELSLYQDYTTYFAFYNQLQTLTSEYSPEDINLFLALFNANAFSFNVNDISIDMDSIVSSGLMDAYQDNIYTIHLDLYNSHDDYTPVDFEVRIGDYIPGVFIESIIQDGDNYYVNGLVNGATSLSLNSVDATVTDGYFEAIIPITNQEIDYVLHSYFNSQFTGTIVLEDDINHPTVALSSEDDIIINEGDTYVLPICTASDQEDSTIECVQSTSPELSDEPGEYEILYYAIDTYGNRSNEIIIHLIIIEDNNIPIITLTSLDDITITEGQSYQLPSCNASDVETLNIACIVSITPLLSTDPGVYEIRYTAEDNAGNVAVEELITLTILDDTSPPIITLSDSNDITVEEGVSYHLPTCTAIDDIFGEVLCDVSYVATEINAVGIHTVTYSATDINGNTTTEEITVTITEAPLVCEDGYHIENDTCVLDIDTTDTTDSSSGLIIGAIIGGSILVVGAGAFFVIRRIRVL